MTKGIYTTQDKTVLQQEIEHQLRQAAWSWSGSPGVIRAEAPIEPVALLPWLQAQAMFPKMYWADRDTPWKVAGIGSTDTLAGSSRTGVGSIVMPIQSILASSHPRVRYYGGFSFDPSPPVDRHWEAFGAYTFTIPQFEILCQNGQFLLACNVMVHGAACLDIQIEEAVSRIESISFSTAPFASAPLRLINQNHVPDKTEWMSLVKVALEDIASTSLQKVVLVRKTTFEFDVPLDPVAVLAQLVEHTIASYHFCFQPNAAGGFVGASPELLYARNGRDVVSEALAGTRPRSVVPFEDDMLARELLTSNKERLEQQLVYESMIDVLQERCCAIDSDPEVRVLKLRTCQHLLQTIRGTLKPGIGDVELLPALHPTPAVGGRPTDKALAWLAAHESFNRFWYAGPVGWIQRDASKFAVAIRSGLIAGDTLTLFAGAGIVNDSKPESEWNEINHKLDSFLNAIAYDK